jgi:hypothetical protein
MKIHLRPNGILMIKGNLDESRHYDVDSGYREITVKNDWGRFGNSPSRDKRCG